MAALSGLAAVRERLERKSGGDFEDRQKATWLTVAPDSSVKITPLQELDESSPNFSAKNGTALFNTEHSNPDDFKKKASCTNDEGPCFGCEQKWSQKTSLYINVLVDDGKQEPYVALWSRGVGKNSVANQLLDMAADEDFNFSITGTTFKLTRSGSGKDSTYSLMALKASDKNVEDYDLWDVHQAPFKVDYERQEAYYLDGQVAKAAAPAAPPTASSVNNEW